MAASVLGFSITDKTQSEMKRCIESKQMLNISDERLPHPMCVCVILYIICTNIKAVMIIGSLVPRPRGMR